MPPSSIAQAFSASAFRELGHAWLDQLADALAAAQAGGPKVVPQPRVSAAWLAAWRQLLDGPAPAAGGTTPLTGGAAPLQLLEAIFAGSNRPHHPGYMGHQVATPLPLAALCEAAAGLLNNSLAVFETGPAGSAIEQAVVKWMARRLGFPDTADGAFVSGGSLANLMGLLAARHERAGFALWQDGAHAGPPLAALASAQAHYCSGRAVQLMGWGKAGLVQVACDARYRLRPEELEAARRGAERAGRKVVAVVASACSTATGSFDPLPPIADFCERHGLWLHVDGAHGASAVLSDKYRARVAGIERADSVAWDAHKMLMMPALSTGILFRDGAVARRLFAQEASYLFQDGDTLDLAQRTIECTKRMLAMPLFVCLATYGEALFAEHVTTCFDLAARFAELLAAQPDFELAVEPECNIVCFRHLPPAVRAAPLAEQNRWQAHVRAKVVADGGFYLVQTTLGEAVFLRTTLINPLSTERELTGLLDQLRRAGEPPPEPRRRPPPERDNAPGRFLPPRAPKSGHSHLMSLDQLAARRITKPPYRLPPEELAALRALLPITWQLDGDSLQRRVKTPNYAVGVALVVAIGRLADELDHHPELRLRWGSLDLQLWTHDVQGLSEVDFVLAARIEQCIHATLEQLEP